MWNKLSFSCVAGLLACAALPVTGEVQNLIFYDDFSKGYTEGFLGGQKGWKGTGLKLSPVVVNLGEGEWCLSGYKGDHMAKFATDGFGLTREDRVLLEMTVSVPLKESYSVALGIGMATPNNMPATFCITGKGILIRGATYGGKQSFAVSRNGQPWNLAGAKIILRSTWDLRTGEASLYLKNLSREEQEFTRLYFDALQQDGTAPIGTVCDVGDWSELMIRMGGGAELKIHDILIKKTTETEMKQTTEPMEHLTLYRIGNSLTWDSQPNGIAELAIQRNILHDTGYHIRSGLPPSYMWENPLEKDVPPNQYGLFGDALPNYRWDAVAIQPYKSPGVPTTLLDDETVILSMIDLTRQNADNTNTTFYIYAAWPNQYDTGITTNGYETYWTSAVVASNGTPTQLKREYFAHLIDRVRAGTDATVYMITVGEVLYELDLRLRNGEVSGYTSIVQLYRDAHHLTYDIGRFVAGLTVLSVVHELDPEGVVQPDNYYQGTETFTPEMYAAIYASIQSVVLNDPDTGVP